jgi:hypothetical protein
MRLDLKAGLEGSWGYYMCRLVQPDVSKTAALAAFATALLCYPRFALWTERTHPVWYLEATTFCGSFVLWAFVFAWHTHYTQRPVFTLKIGRGWEAATVAGVLMAVLLHSVFDPSVRQTTPLDYPADLAQWVAMTLFGLALNQLFLVFAPFAWLMRLFQRMGFAVALTVAFDVAVLLLKSDLSPESLPLGLLLGLVGARLMLGLLGVAFYLQGGVWQASWFALLVQARHLVVLVG